MPEVSNTRTTGRLAGLAYLAVIACSSFGYLTTTALLGGDLSGTGRMAAEHPLLMMAMAASVVGLAAWAVLAVLLHRIMSAASPLGGGLMLMFTASGVAMNLIALWPLYPVLFRAGGGLDVAGLAPMVESSNHLLLLAQVFSGLWLLPLAWLILRSRSLPWLLALCLTVAAFWYLAQFGTALDPDFGQSQLYRIVGAIAGPAVFLGEFGTCAWLLAMGARAPFAAPPLVRLQGPHMGQGRPA
jgi:hypothetical protein